MEESVVLPHGREPCCFLDVKIWLRRGMLRLAGQKCELKLTDMQRTKASSKVSATK